MSLALHLMGENAHTFFQLWIPISPFRISGGKALITLHRNQRQLRPFPEKPGNDLLILTRCKGTSRIKHLSSRLQHICRIQTKLFLNSGKLLRLLRSPVSGKSFLLTEHPLPGTRCIQNDLMEKFWKIFYHFFRLFIGNKKIGNPKQFQVSKQCSCPGSADIICNQKSFTL